MCLFLWRLEMPELLTKGGKMVPPMRHIGVPNKYQKDHIGFKGQQICVSLYFPSHLEILEVSNQRRRKMCQ